MSPRRSGADPATTSASSSRGRRAPRIDPPEPVHPFPIGPVSRGAPLDRGETGSASNRARRGAPNRVRDRAAPGPLPGDPATLVRLRRPIVGTDPCGARTTDPLRIHGRVAHGRVSDLVLPRPRERRDAVRRAAHHAADPRGARPYGG